MTYNISLSLPVERGYQRLLRQVCRLYVAAKARVVVLDDQEEVSERRTNTTPRGISALGAEASVRSGCGRNVFGRRLRLF